ncbi:midnolin-B-like [Aplochiton taeniatus]
MDRHQSSAGSVIYRGSQVCGSYDPPMHLSISTTTGCQFELCVPFGETVEGLRRRLSQKLRVSRDRIALLHKDRQLMEGKLVDQGVADESKLTLVPTIEAGLMSQPPKTEKTMMQALDNLTEAQVSDFLSGRSPLTLALGVGAHMMYVQLQLASPSALGQQQQQQPQTEARSRSDGRVLSGAVDSTARPCPPNAPPTTKLHAQLPASPRSPPPPSNKIPVICRHPQFSPPTSCTPEAQRITPCSSLTSSPELPAPSLPSRSAPHRSSLFPTAPFHSSYPPCSSPGPQSPAPAATFPGGEHQTPSPAKQSTEPGAVIESFVNHCPGVFSGTFSGTLPTVNQSAISHPRRGITTILQILNDLLSATRHHQGAPPSLSQLHCPTPSPPAGPQLTPKTPYKATSEPLMIGKPEPKQLNKPAGDGSCSQRSPEENLALRSKLDRLHFLMHQRRLRRRARRGTHSAQASHLYPQRHGHLWLPRQRRAARCRSNDSLSVVEGNSPDDLENMQSPWEPELTSDIIVA